MIDKIKEFVLRLNEIGIPVPIIRDGVTGKPSLTFTLCYINGIIALGGLIGKITKLTDGVDLDSAKEMLIVTGSLYLGRTLTRGLSDKPQKEENK